MKTIWLCIVVTVMLSVSALGQGWPQPVKDGPNQVLVTGSGEVLMQGQRVFRNPTTGFNNWVLSVTKWSNLGVKQWTQEYLGTFMQFNINGFLLGKDGKIYVAGSHRNRNGIWADNKGADDAFIICIDSLGQESWLKKYGTENNDFINTLSLSADGGLIVSGQYSVYGNPEPYFLMKLDGNGNICPLAITTQPTGPTVLGGHQTAMSVTATSTVAITYQWQRNDGSGWVNVTDGTDYSGSTSAILTIKVAKVSKKGPYRCAVSAGECTLYSNEATLTVNCPCNE